jgi:hypothetical protein
MSERFEARLEQVHQATFAPREGWEVEFPTFPFLNLALMQGFALGLLASGRESSPVYRDAWVRMARIVMVPLKSGDAPASPDSSRGT